MNEKQTLWQKSKAFLKKYWHVAAAFVAGILSTVFYFLRISRPTNRGNLSIGKELEQLTVGFERAEEGLSELTDNNEQARNLNTEQRETLTSIGNRHAGIEGNSEAIGDSIQRIKQLIEAERERVEAYEGKE